MKRIKHFSDRSENFFIEFDAAFHPLWNIPERCIEPLVDIIINENELIVTADLPYVSKKDDIILNISEDSLEINASINKELNWEKWGTVQKKIFFNSFKKVIYLPEKVEVDKAAAKFRNGILRIIIPRIKNKFQINIE